MPDCIFCQIVSGKIPGYKIYEDKEFLAFLDIFPKTEGHTLIIPKQHYPWVWDYPDPGRYFAVTTKLAQHLKKVSGQEVRALIYGFDVAHAHIHLMPGKTNELEGQKVSAETLAKIQQVFTTGKNR